MSEKTENPGDEVQMSTARAGAPFSGPQTPEEIDAAKADFVANTPRREHAPSYEDKVLGDPLATTEEKK